MPNSEMRIKKPNLESRIQKQHAGQYNCYPILDLKRTRIAQMSFIEVIESLMSLYDGLEQRSSRAAMGPGKDWYTPHPFPDPDMHAHTHCHNKLNL